MDWINNINKIKDDLYTHGYIKSVDDITNAQMVLGTPGEMYLEVMQVLLFIKNNNLPEFQIIKNNVEDLLNYGKSIGYFIHD